MVDRDDDALDDSDWDIDNDTSDDDTSDGDFGDGDDPDDDLVACPHCKSAIYEDSVQCPACGEYVTFDHTVWSGRSWLWIVLGLLGVIATIWGLAMR
jgi:hypothetical protein